MAIGATLLTSAYNNANQTSYTTASISPAANSLLLMWVYDAIATPIVPKGVPTGLSLTWEEVGTRRLNNGEKRISAFIAQCGGSPGSGTVTITETDMGGGTTAIGCAWSIIEITGHHVTHPVRQPVFPAGTIASHLTSTTSFPDAEADSNSRPFAAYGLASAGTDVTPRTNWTELSDVNGNSPFVLFATQWRSDAFEGTASASYGAATDVLFSILEIAEASAPDPVDAATIAERVSTQGVLTSSVAVAMPDGLTAGDLLIATISTDGNTSAAAGGGEGWTNITDAANGSDVRLNILAKIATGGDALNLTLGAAVDSATHVMRILNHGVSNVSTDIEVGTPATGTSTTPDPPSVTPAANAKNLFIAVAASDDDDDATNFSPTNYASGEQAQSSSTATSCLIQVSYRYLTTGSAENPGAFALVASEQWVTQSLCVPPAAGATDATINATTVTIPVEVPTPTITASATITASTVTVPVEVPQPAVTASAGITPDPVTITAEIPQPTVTATATISPDPVVIPVEVPAATVTTIVPIAPDPVTIPIEVPTPTITATATITPDPVVIPIEVPQATVTASATISPDPVTIPVEVPLADVDVTASGTITPDPVTIPVEVPAATITTTATITPDPVVIPVQVPTPAVTASATITPSPVDVVVEVPQPTITATATVTPDPVVIPIEVPTPTIGLTQSISPDPVTVLVEVPIATIIARDAAVAELILTPHCVTPTKVVVGTTSVVRLQPTTTVLTLGVSE